MDGRKRLALIRERRWHAKDEQCGICGRVGRCVDLDSAYVRMRICLRCATIRMRATQKVG